MWVSMNQPQGTDMHKAIDDLEPVAEESVGNGGKIDLLKIRLMSLYVLILSR